MTLVVALTTSGDALFWGSCRDDVTVDVPQLVQGVQFPREVFARGLINNTAGSVYPG